MSAIDRLLAKLPGAKSAGGGWAVRCPAHDDRRASLSISEGDDGRALVRCHAGCTVEAVVAAVGLAVSDLMPDCACPPHNGKPKPSGKTFPIAAAALAELKRLHGERSALWEYHDAAGNLVGLVVRWDRADGKDIRPAALHADGWRIAAMPDPRPLYRLFELARAKHVVVTEGEKAADAARSIGLVATTSAGGSGAAAKADWTPLAGKDVWILPDNDPPGRKYAVAVAGALAKLTPPATARVVELPNLPEKGDIVDWIEGHGDAAEPDGMRAEFEALSRAVEPAPAGRAPAGGPGRGVRAAPDLLRLSDVVPAPVPWLWPGRIPLGRITVLSGRGGEGKSYLTCDLAARITAGAAWPDGGAAPAGSVLFICAEDDPADTIAPRLDAAGADRRRAHLLRAVKVTDAAGKETAVAFDLANVDMIGAALDRLPDCKLVVIDPIGSYLGGRVDAHRDNEVRAVLAPLAALAAEREISVLLVAHTRKGSGSFADDTVLGSRAFTALARSVWHLTADENDRTRRLVLPGKCNLAAPAPGLAFRITPDSSVLVGRSPRLEWEPDPLTGAHADDFLADRGSGAGRGPDPTARAAAADWLAELLGNGPVAVADVKSEAMAAELTWKTIQRARDALGVNTRKRSFGGGWEWSIPTRAKDAQEPSAPPKVVK